MKPPITPFANEADSLVLGDFNIENRLDRVSLYGSLDLTRDKAGLTAAKKLKELVDATVKQLEADSAAGTLPDAVHVVPAESVKNPFG